NTSVISISNNPVLHSRTKHIDIKYHFIKDHILKGDIELHFVPTDLQLADIFTKPLAEPSFTRLVAELGMLNIEKHVPDKKKTLNMALNTISFTLSHLDKTLSFDIDTFFTVIKLKPSDDCVPVPQKETMKAGLATLGLVDEEHPSLSSTDLINSSSVKGSHDQLNVNQQTIAYCLCWGLNIYIAYILFSELIAHLHPEGAKKERRPNVADLSPEPIQSLIRPSKEVNADDTTDKSLSGTSMLPVTQPKAPTAKRLRKKKILSSTHPEQAEEFVATADITKSLDASESTKEQGNQPKTADAEKVLVQNLVEEEKDIGLHSLGDVTFEQLMDEVEKQNKAAQEEPESPYDTESEIKFVKPFKVATSDINEHLADSEMIINMGSEAIDMNLGDFDADSDLHSMLDDDLRSLTGFETQISDEDDEVSFSDHLSKEDIYDNLYDNLYAISDGDAALPNSSADVSALSDPLGHLRRELTILSTKVNQLESSISNQVSKELKSSVPTLVTDALKDTLPSLLADALKASLPSLIRDSGEQKSKDENMADEHLPNPLQQKILVEQFTDQLFNTTSSIYSPSPPRDPSKGKGVATEEP
ncbi:hypothetical protein Tco_1257960, partial [Tanacetum coccineum]